MLRYDLSLAYQAQAASQLQRPSLSSISDQVWAGQCEALPVFLEAVRCNVIRFEEKVARQCNSIWSDPTNFETYDTIQMARLPVWGAYFRDFNYDDDID